MNKSQVLALHREFKRSNFTNIDDDDSDLIWFICIFGKVPFFSCLKKLLKTDYLIKRAIINADFTVLD